MWGPRPPPATWATPAPCRPSKTGVRESWQERRRSLAQIPDSGCRWDSGVQQSVGPTWRSSSLSSPSPAGLSCPPSPLSQSPDQNDDDGGRVDDCQGTIPVTLLSQGPTWRELLRKNQLSSWAAWKISTSWENIWISQGIPSGKIRQLHSLKIKQSQIKTWKPWPCRKAENDACW